MQHLITPVSLQLGRELFHQTYLTSSHYPDKDLAGEPFSALLLMDYFVGLMRLPYLYFEVKRIQKIQQEGETFRSSLELRYQTLSTFANALEIFIWFYEKKWILISKRSQKMIQTISYLSRMVLYEHAVRKGAVSFFEGWRHPELINTVGYKHLKVSLISHSAFLGWVTISFISHIKGVPYPRPFLKMLRVTSVAFGLIAMGYDQESEINQVLKMLRPHLPNGEIYR